jgi:tryptophanyl-tRNA synthetase
MAADILLYDADIVPVGKDQMQHLEIAADIARAFNHKVGKDVFVVPAGKMDDRVMIVPGTDGQKMSKSYNNFINIFLPEKELKKVISGIVTDSKGLEEPKDPQTDNVFRIFELVASPDETQNMRNSYLKGGFGYGHAKAALLEIILRKFAEPREKFTELMSDPEKLEKALSAGEKRAAAIANEKLKQVRSVLGYN